MHYLTSSRYKRREKKKLCITQGRCNGHGKHWGCIETKQHRLKQQNTAHYINTNVADKSTVYCQCKPDTLSRTEVLMVSGYREVDLTGNVFECEMISNRKTTQVAHIFKFHHERRKINTI